MKTRNNFSLVIALTALLFAGCNKDNGDIDNNGAGKEEVKFNVGMADAVAEITSLRAAGDHFPDYMQGTSVKFSVTDNSGSNYFTGEKLNDAIIGGVTSGTIDRNDITFTTPYYWDDLGGKNASIKVAGIINPTTATITGNGKVTGFELSNTIADCDLLVANPTSFTYPTYPKPNTDPIHLEFEHVLSKITIKVLEGTGVDAAAEWKEVTLSYTGHTKADYNYAASTPEFESFSTSKKVDIANTGTVTAPVFNFLAFPMDTTANHILATIKVKRNNGSGGADYYNEYNIDLGAAFAGFDAGNHYTYNVTIHESGIHVTGSIVDWNIVTGVDRTSSLVEPDDIVIAEDTNTKLSTNKSILYLYLKDVDNAAHTTNYTYKGMVGANQNWTVNGTELYWDDMHLPISADALLNLDPSVTGNPSGENIFVSSKGAQGLATSITLPPFTRPLAKITLNITTTTGADAVNLDEITEVFFEDLGGFSVNTTTGAVAQNFTDIKFENSSTADKKRTTYTIYVYPQSPVTKLCEVTIQENATVENTYNVPITSINFEAGKHYTYNVEIKKSAVHVTGSLVDWANGGDSNIDTDLGK